MSDVVKQKRGRTKFNDPRMNMAFYGDNMKFCQFAAYKNHQSVTAFVNSLISREMAKHDKAEWENFNLDEQGRVD